MPSYFFHMFDQVWLMGPGRMRVSGSGSRSGFRGGVRTRPRSIMSSKRSPPRWPASASKSRMMREKLSLC